MNEDPTHHASLPSPESIKRLVIKNFIAGISWGIGSVLGATIIISLLLNMFKAANVIPVIGNILAQIESEVEKHR